MRSQVRHWQRWGVKEGLASQRNITQVNRFWQANWVKLQKVLKPEIRIS